MIYIHFYCNNKLLTKRRVEYAPRVGDEARFDGEYYKVTLVIWCYDEESDMGQRMNIALEKVTA